MTIREQMFSNNCTALAYRKAIPSHCLFSIFSDIYAIRTKNIKIIFQCQTFLGDSFSIKKLYRVCKY